ncbi:AMP-binding protein [Flavobacteriaceae bacterium F89]|uniref:AMP-binding protein n=1 Tax=Cerina litoralis TaxID=2874477 RepID=A0AAE3ETX9_9FLAO|nr:AMP-binding protein [Cerina litoralis]MCG2460913.1 AMP-binding protein [Cerina litoralis]
MKWTPDQGSVKNSNIYKTMQAHGFTSYPDFWKWSVNEKQSFWTETMDRLGIRFKQRYSKVLDIPEGVENAKWLSGAQFNIVDSCFQNVDDATAIIFQKPNGSLQKTTQKELEILVNRIANGLTDLQIGPGDSIAIDTAMTLEAVAVYLAAIKAGVVVATIADSFSAREIAVRLKITKPKLVFTQDVLLRGSKKLPLYQKVLEAGAPKAVVIKMTELEPELREGDLDWETFVSDNTNFQSVISEPDDTITVLFSSGTTGEPKAIPWTHITPIKSASDGYYHHDIQKNNVVCWPTNLGWMMGPWLIFATLINKGTIALYYDAPLDLGFGEFVQNAKVNMLGVVPSIVKSWMGSKCNEHLDWNAIKCFSSTGEVSNPTEMEYLMQLGNHKPVIEYCGGTEIGGGYVTSTVVQENIPSTFSSQALGGAFLLLDHEGKAAEKGEVFLVPPILGLSDRLLNRDHHKVYFKDTPTYQGVHLRRHGDQLQRLENGYYKALGRMDDDMNLGGIKVSSVQIEAVVNRLDFVKESAAIAVSPKDGGPSELFVYYVKSISEKPESDRLHLVNRIIKKELNPLFKATQLIPLESLPRTASNKVMRRMLRDRAEG